MKARLCLLAVGLVGLAGIAGRAFSFLPPVGGVTSPYGDRINAGTRPERRAQDAVTAVTFDYRGFDTFAEELILFVSVMGAVVLLREASETKGSLCADHARDRNVPPESDSVRAWTMAMTGPTVLYGLYLASHGQLSPGGGFQAGVVLATAPLLVYLAAGFDTMRKIAAHRWLETAKSLGMLGFLATGGLALFRHEPFLTNVLPLGKAGDVFSSGTIFTASLATGLEVGAGLVLLLSTFLQETLAEPQGDAEREEEDAS